MEPFTAEALYAALHTRALGRHAVLMDGVDSTNAEARRQLSEGLPDGAVFIADQQTGGRGRRGRRWVSEPGCGLWMTAVIHPFMALDEMQKLTLLAGLAVCGAVERTVGVTPAIKWPNDVLARGRKLCGILCESAVDGDGQRVAIVGIGVNTLKPPAGWDEAGGVAISLAEAAGRAVGRLTLAAVILDRMEELLDRWRVEGFGPIAAGYRGYMMPAGTPVEIIDGTARRHGRIEGLDDSGALLVQLAGGGTERVISGEISVRGVVEDV